MNLVNCKTQNGGFLKVKLDTDNDNVYIYSDFDKKEHIRKAKYFIEDRTHFHFKFNKRYIIAYTKETV